MIGKRQKVVNLIVTTEKVLSNIIGKRQKVVNVIVTSEKYYLIL